MTEIFFRNDILNYFDGTISNILDFINTIHLIDNETNFLIDKYGYGPNFKLSHKLAIFESVYWLIRYLIINQNMLLTPSLILKLNLATKNIYRCGRLQSINTDETNPNYKYFPELHSVAGQCSTPSTYVEPIWFGISKNSVNNYLGLNDSKKYGVLTCKTLKDFTKNDDGINLFINISDLNKPRYINKNLLQIITNSIYIQILYKYTNYFDLTYQEYKIGKSYINDQLYIKFATGKNSRPEDILLIKQVNGFECNPRYIFESNEEMKDILSAWSIYDGTRQSYNNVDRLHANELFNVLDLIETFINYKFKNNIFVSSQQSLNLIGTICGNNYNRGLKSIFPGEYIIARKYLQTLNEDVFEIENDSCQTIFYKYDEIIKQTIEISDPLSDTNFQLALSQIGINAQRHRELHPRQYGGDENIINSKYSYKMEFTNIPEDEKSYLFKLFFDVNDVKKNENIQYNKNENLHQIKSNLKTSLFGGIHKHKKQKTKKNKKQKNKKCRRYSKKNFNIN